MKRKQFIHTAAGLGVSALVSEGVLAALATLLEGSSETTPIPHRIGATEIEQVRAATQVFESWSGTYGGGLAREAVIGQLRWSAGLLDATCPDRLRPGLFSAVGDLADVAGYMAMDANAHEQGGRAYRFALACAEEAEDWSLRAEVLSSMAQQAIRTGQPDDGLTLAEHALVRPDRLTATGRALLHTDRGRALAKMRRVSETLAAVGTADEHFAHDSALNDPPCLAFYNDARHAQFIGRTLFDLAVLGHNLAQDVTDRLTAAADGHIADNNTRSRVICLAKLAGLAMITGDPIQAATIGHAALDAAGAIRSRQVTEELHELARYADAHQHLDEVAHLLHRIGTLLRRID